MASPLVTFYIVQNSKYPSSSPRVKFLGKDGKGELRDLSGARPFEMAFCTGKDFTLSCYVLKITFSSYL